MAIKKVINSSTQQFEPVLVDKLVLDAVPTVNSFNSVTSDAVARAVAGASGEVPQVTSEDNGKVLKAIYDEGGAAVEWGSEPTVDQAYDASSENAQSGTAVAEALGTETTLVAGSGISLTESSGSLTIAAPADQTYDSTSTNAQSGVAVAEAIAAIPAPSVDEVPDVTSTDDGKVLTASYSGGQGSYSWETAQGGGSSLPSITGNAYKVLSVSADASATEWVLPLRKTNYVATYDSTRKIYTLSLSSSSYPLYGVEGYFLSTIEIKGSGTSINNLWLLINETQYDDADTHNIDSFYWNKSIPVFSGSVNLGSSQSIRVVTELLFKKKSSGQVKVHLALSTSPNISDVISSASIAYVVTGRLMEKI